MRRHDHPLFTQWMPALLPHPEDGISVVTAVGPHFSATESTPTKVGPYWIGNATYLGGTVQTPRPEACASFSSRSNSAWWANGRDESTRAIPFFSISAFTSVPSGRNTYARDRSLSSPSGSYWRRTFLPSTSCCRKVRPGFPGLNLMPALAACGGGCPVGSGPERAGGCGGTVPGPTLNADSLLLRS